MLGGRPKRRVKPQRFTHNRLKSPVAGRSAPRRSLSRRRKPRADDYSYANTGYDDYTYDNDFSYYEDRTYNAFDDEDSFFEERNDNRRPRRDARQTRSCGGLPTKFFFCADDASRDDTESEITDNFSNESNRRKMKDVFASCLCFDQEFSFKVVTGKHEKEKTNDEVKSQMHLLQEEAPRASRGIGRNKLVKYIPSVPVIPSIPKKRYGRERERDRRGLRMYDEDTFVSMDRSIDIHRHGRRMYDGDAYGTMDGTIDIDRFPRGRIAYDDATWSTMDRSIDINRLAPGSRMYDDATYASMDPSLPSLLDLGMLDELAATSKYRCGSE